MHNPNNQQFRDSVNIKSKYLSSNEQRQIIINPQNSHISISHSGNPDNYKQFHIDQLSAQTFQGNRITLSFDNGRTYQIQSQQPQRISQALQHAKNVQLSSRFQEQSITDKPVFVNYCQPSQTVSRQSTGQHSNIYFEKPQGQHLIHLNQLNQIHNGHQPNIANSPQFVMKNQLRLRSQLQQCRKQKQNELKYTKMTYFHRPEDWEINPEEGTLVAINQNWKGNTTKIFGFVLKRFLTTGSFMGISFPVFAMKPESILQSYGKCLGSAVNVITNTKNPLQRLKQFTCLLWIISFMQVTMVKPFNPVIGQTFQADIKGGRYSAEQVCHHPPVSAFYYQKDNYKIYASLELSASIGLNSGDGRFLGDITIEYKDGYWCKGKLPNGKITGVLIGTTTFQPYGGSYVYDSNKCVLTYRLNDNIFEGQLGFLNYKTQQQFESVLKDPERFIKFQSYQQKQYSKILSHFRAKYTQWVTFDNKQYINLNNPAIMPYQLELPFDHLLKSDSRFRLDIELLKDNKIDEAQEEKQRIQNQERQFRKLREQHSQ